MLQRYFDYWIVYFVVKGPVALGVAILLASIVPARKLGIELPSGIMRLRWQFLTWLIVILILGYFAYIGTDREVNGDLEDLLVPVLFFLIACFVHVVNCFSLETAHDIRRVAFLEHENSIDSLMGIFNRRHLDRTLGAEVARARRLGSALSVLILDLDHFKDVNDHYGHQVGDRVLSLLGQLLLKTCRHSDILSRYGGEEVVLIARNTPLSDAAELAERLRKVVESELRLPIEVERAERELQVTASIGVSELTSGIRDGESLIASADRALYEAKHAGRNRVFLSDPSFLEPRSSSIISRLTTELIGDLS
jgi:diguanylate cyclase (GGDEF)-like protein